MNAQGYQRLDWRTLFTGNSAAVCKATALKTKGAGACARFFCALPRSALRLLHSL